MWVESQSFWESLWSGNQNQKSEWYFFPLSKWLSGEHSRRPRHLGVGGVGVLFYLPPVEQFCCEYLSSTIIVPFMPDIWKQSTAFGVSHHHLITEKAPQLRAQCCYLSLVNVKFCYQQYVKIKPVSGLKHSAKSLKDPYFSTHLSCTHGWLQHRKQNGIHKT